MTKRMLLVAAAALIDSDGRVLICQRPPGKQLAGLWEFPGGKVEAGETPEAAALREAAEEVGLDPRLPQILGRLPQHVTGTGYHVVPVVALLHPPFTVTPAP